MHYNVVITSTMSALISEDITTEVHHNNFMKKPTSLILVAEVVDKI